MTKKLSAPDRHQTDPAPSCSRQVTNTIKTINLALNGSGTHGSFAWGVLDRLLDDERVTIEGISATSAGALNAVVLAYGVTVGGRDGAKRALAGFWRRISHVALFNPMLAPPIERLAGDRQTAYSLSSRPVDWNTQVLSLYRFKLANYSPVREILAQIVDFEVLGRACPIKLFLSATNIRTGKIEVFENAETNPDTVLASAGPPFQFRPIEIGDETYWDGGSMSTPTIVPLVRNCDTRDVITVRVDPWSRGEVPRSAAGIQNRVSQIVPRSFHGRELRTVDFDTELTGDDTSGSLKQLYIHSISDEQMKAMARGGSQLQTDWGFLTELRDRGRHRADAWIAEHFDCLGKTSTANICPNHL